MIKKFFTKVFLPTLICSVISYFVLGYAHPNMPERLRIFVSSWWVLVPLLITMGMLGFIYFLKLITAILQRTRNK